MFFVIFSFPMDLFLWIHSVLLTNMQQTFWLPLRRFARYFYGFFLIGWMNKWICENGWQVKWNISLGMLFFQPISRPLYVQQYKVTAYSLYAAASTGLSTEEIIKNLSKFCKTNLPDEVVSFIKVTYDYLWIPFNHLYSV